MSGATGGGSETEQRTAYTGTKLETADTAKNVLKPPRYPSTQVNDHVNDHVNEAVAGLNSGTGPSATWSFSCPCRSGVIS